MRLSEISWPITAAGEAMQVLATYARLPHRAMPLPQAPAAVQQGQACACRTWMHSTAEYLHLQIESKPLTYGSVPELLGRGPWLLETRLPSGPRLLLVLGSWSGTVQVIGPQRSAVRIRLATLRSLLAASLEREVEASLTHVLREAGMAGPARSRVLQSMFAERLGPVRIAEGWKLELPSSASTWAQVQRARLPANLGAFLSAYTVEYVLWIVSWVLVGRWALEGQLDVGWLVGWMLLLLTLIPIHVLAMWSQAKLAVSGGSLMMRRLLEGAFKLNPEEVRYRSVGQLLGRVLDAQALQSLALTGGLLALVAVIELMISAGILAMGAGSWPVVLVLLAWMALTAGLALAYYRRRRDWTSARLEVTQDLIERMVGHRTRLAQQPRERWHDGEDEVLARYVEKSRRIDLLNTAGMALLPRGWLIAGLAALAPSFLAGAQTKGALAAHSPGLYRPAALEHGAGHAVWGRDCRRARRRLPGGRQAGRIPR